MTLELTSEQESIVLRLADETGKAPAELMIEAMAHLEWLDDEKERQLIEARAAEADRNDATWISHEEVGRRLGLI